MPRSKNIEDYFQIWIEELIPEQSIPFSLHLYFEQSRHLMRWKADGDVLSSSFLQRSVEKGIRKIWIHQEDREAYQRYRNPEAKHEANLQAKPQAAPDPAPCPIREATQAIAEAFSSDKLSAEEKKTAIAARAQDLIRVSVAPETPKEQVESNKKLGDAVSDLLNDILDGTRDAARAQMTEIWKLARLDPDFDHAVNVSTFSVIFAMAFGRIDSDLLADIALAGLLHDIGLSQIPAGLASMPWKSFNEQQLATYALHVEFGVQLLKEHGKDLSARVGEIISQHHEKFNGSGYPHKLNGFKVDDISQLLSIADILDSFATGQWDGIRRTLRDTFDMLEQLETTSTFPEYFNPDVFAAIIGWIHSTRSRDARQNAVNLVQDQTLQLLKRA